MLAGFVFRVSQPELLPIGLVLVSFYSFVSYGYYAFMLAMSPYRTRRDIINELNSWEPEFTAGSKVNMYFGPTKFETSPWYSDREMAQSYVDNLPNAFPKVLGARVSAKIISDQRVDYDGEVCRTYAVEIEIPIRCRLAAVLQDVDYSMPMWLNAVALIAYGWALCR